GVVTRWVEADWFYSNRFLFFEVINYTWCSPLSIMKLRLVFTSFCCVIFGCLFRSYMFIRTAVILSLGPADCGPCMGYVVCHLSAFPGRQWFRWNSLCTARWNDRVAVVPRELFVHHPLK
ncbi:hypothetical protein V8G54_032705, partial [Vigna mungo]